jgi:hypothetical protein
VHRTGLEAAALARTLDDMDNSSIFKSARYAPALFLLASFGLAMIAFDDLGATWRRIAAALLLLGVLAGLAGWPHESIAFIIKDWSKCENGSPMARLVVLRLFSLIYAGLAVVMVLGLNKLVDVWPFDDQRPSAATVNQPGTSPADASASADPSPDTPTK